MQIFRLIAVAFAAIASSSPLQSQFQSRIQNLARQGDLWSFELLFRNSQPAAPPGTVNPIWSITGFEISIPTMLSKCGQACEISAFGLRSVGSVDTRRLNVGGAQWINQGTGGWSGDESCIQRCSGLPVYADPGNMGILGCQMPVSNPTAIWFYTARTCDEDGYSGWMAWTVIISFGAPVTQFGADEIVLTPTLRQIGTVTAAIVPEPALNHLVIAGFVLLLSVVNYQRVQRTDPGAP